MPEPRAFLGGGRLLIRWTQAVEGSATFEVVRPDGSVVVSRNFRGVSGANQAALAGISGLVIFRLRTPDGAWTKRIAEVR